MAVIEWLFEFAVDTAVLTGGLMMALFILYILGVVIYVLGLGAAVVAAVPFWIVADRTESLWSRFLSLIAIVAMFAAGAALVFWIGRLFRWW
jgi:hypothetical protein